MAFLSDSDNGRCVKDIAATWGIGLEKVHGGLEIAGSPERSLSRIVVEDGGSRRYVLEEIAEKELPGKKRIAENLSLIKERGVPLVNPYLLNREGRHHSEYKGRYFQISAYLAGVPLKRPEYVNDGWRGKVLADFLVEFYEKAAGADLIAETSAHFSITSYIEDIVRKIEIHNPEIIQRVKPVTAFLEKEFTGAHDRIPLSFCHGDYHVLNVIWSTAGLNGVIDWEFSGLRPEIYDMANMIGCIGIEDPRALTGPLVKAFIASIEKAGRISDTGWCYFTEFVIALRFALLSEWLRHKDKAMIDLELVYMNLLVENNDLLFRNF